jgi:hypothetical protein
VGSPREADIRAIADHLREADRRGARIRDQVAAADRVRDNFASGLPGLETQLEGADGVNPPGGSPP